MEKRTFSNKGNTDSNNANICFQFGAFKCDLSDELLFNDKVHFWCNVKVDFFGEVKLEEDYFSK